MSKKLIMTEAKLKELVSSSAKAIAEQVMNESHWSEDSDYDERTDTFTTTMDNLMNFIPYDEYKLTEESDCLIDDFFREVPDDDPVVFVKGNLSPNCSLYKALYNGINSITPEKIKEWDGYDLDLTTVVNNKDKYFKEMVEYFEWAGASCQSDWEDDADEREARWREDYESRLGDERFEAERERRYGDF